MMKSDSQLAVLRASNRPATYETSPKIPPMTKESSHVDKNTIGESGAPNSRCKDPKDSNPPLTSQKTNGESVMKVATWNRLGYPIGREEECTYVPYCSYKPEPDESKYGGDDPPSRERKYYSPSHIRSHRSRPTIGSDRRILTPTNQVRFTSHPTIPPCLLPLPQAPQGLHRSHHHLERRDGREPPGLSATPPSAPSRRSCGCASSTARRRGAEWRRLR